MDSPPRPSELRSHEEADESPTPRPARFVRPPPPALARDCALFLDIDGTLAELAQTPDAVRIDEAIAQALPRLARELDGALALVTGRSITSADQLFPGLKLAMAGQHGCERRDATGTIHLHAPRKETYTKLCKLFRALAKRHPELLIEDKGAAIALHYRAVPQLAAHVHRTLRRSIRDAEGYTLQEGKMLIEVRPEGRDKGAAIDDFMAESPFAGRVPVFIGDDLTDEHGFATVERLGGWTIKVGVGRTMARYRLPNVRAVSDWLMAPMAAEAVETPT
jgi:trehalose 6-phosphate phosphatase